MDSCIFALFYMLLPEKAVINETETDMSFNKTVDFL